MLSIALNRVRARKTARGENPTGDFYGRMSQIIKFAVGMQMSPVQYRRITGRAGNAEQADVRVLSRMQPDLMAGKDEGLSLW